MSDTPAFIDTEFKEIAEKLVKKYPQLLAEDMDIPSVYFIRTPDIEPKWISRIRRCGHPWNKLPGADAIVYLVETADEKWKLLNEAQRTLVVLHELKHIPSGGFTDDSDDFGKLIEHTVQDFLECIAAAGGDPFWSEPGRGSEIVDLLKEDVRFNTASAMQAAVGKIIEKTSTAEAAVEVKKV